MSKGAGRHKAGTIAFAHANAYPAATYETLFAAWRRAGWRVVAPARLGHDATYPVVSNWRPTRDELIHFIESEAPGEKVQLVGHSLGGYLSLLAACKRPDLAACVVLIDAPLVTGWRAHSLRAMKLTGLIDRMGPGKVSSVRRWQWDSRDDAHQHYAAKRLFARWHPQVLRDYIAAGLEPDEQGVRLHFQREVETRFYRTLPHHLGALLRRHAPRCPVSYIGGTQSAEMRQAGMAATLALVRERVQWIEGSHLVPMEQPEAVAAAALRALQAAR